ncbi:MAG: hypothetical protein ACE5K8_06900 [Candidatus Zixiibacteriota bacterium]
MSQGKRQRLKLLLLLPLVAVTTMGGNRGCFGGGGGDPGDYTEQPPDYCPWWDTDCDSISNATETNDANSYLYLHPDLYDPNPSIAHGWPCSTQCVGTDCGWIEKALNMVNTGTGYYHYLGYPPDPVDTDDWGVLHLINMIEGAGGDWYDYYAATKPYIGVGDLSWGDEYSESFGGYFYPHVCHQNGLEVDIRYVRNDTLHVGLDIATADSIYFDEEKTGKLIDFLIAHANVDSIYVDAIHSSLDTIADFIVHKGGHSDHFHVKIVDPDGTGN